MLNANRFLLAGVAIAMASGPQAMAAPHTNPPILLAQAADQITEAVAQAQAKVDAARAALQKAEAAGSGVDEAQQALDAALKELNDARLAAGLPPATPEPPGGLPKPPEGVNVPVPGDAEAPPKAKEAPAAGEQKPAEPPAEEAKQPPAPKEAPAAEEQKPAEQPPAEEAKQPPAPKEAPAEEQKPAEQPPAAEEAKQPPTPKEAPAAEEQKPAEQPPAEAKQPPAPKEAPTADANGQPPKFDPSMLKKPHPRFGETPKDEAKTQLPKEDAQIPKGGQIDAGAGRTIVKEDSGEVTIRHDDTDRFRRQGGNVDVKKGPDGQTTTTVTRRDGSQVVTIRDSNGDILQRYRKDRNGQIEMLIGQTEGQQRGGNRPPPPPKPVAPGNGFDFGAKLPPLKLTIPRNQYVVESSNASRKQLTQTFEAPPVETVERPYSLEEIRRSDRIRNKVRRVDFDTVTFEFGSAVLPDDQIPDMQKVGEAMKTVLDQDPNEVFLIEGHTDAVGSDLANLALSDRRAETVAEILTYYFGIPPENLVTQGYGEEFLKVPTSGPERANRRVAFRNITPLMHTGSR